MSIRIAPIPFAVAALMAAAPFLGAVGATVANDKAAARAPQVPAATAPSAKAQVRQVVLKTGMAGGKMVYLDDKGNANPVLRGNVGDTIEITIASGEGAEHDIVFEGLGVQSAKSTAGAAR